MSTRPAPAVRLGRWTIWVVVVVGAVLAIVPFLWMVGGSFRSEVDLFADPSRILPQTWTLDGYREVWTELPFLRLVLNSFIFAGVTTVFCLLFDSMAAYALSRLRFRGQTLDRKSVV